MQKLCQFLINFTKLKQNFTKLLIIQENKKSNFLQKKRKSLNQIIKESNSIIF